MNYIKNDMVHFWFSVKIFCEIYLVKAVFSLKSKWPHVADLLCVSCIKFSLKTTVFLTYIAV